MGSTNHKNNTIMLSLSLMIVLVTIFDRGVDGFATPFGVASSHSRNTIVSSSSSQQQHNSARSASASVAAAAAATTSDYNYETVFDFSDPSQNAVASFDRIDDAIMGGISTSSLRQSNGDDKDKKATFASWSGVCRLDGGGFCGTRTLPFQDGTPLQTGNSDGFYLTVRLASDNEPQKRVWKLTTRVENVSRTEQLYQAMFEIPPQQQTDTDDNNSNDSNEWKTIRVPFTDFVQVRGPRIVENGPPLDASNGLFQIGMTMSRFSIAKNATELPDFRPGYFELQIKDIGLYSASQTAAAATTATTTTTTDVAATPISIISTMTKEEAQKDRPIALKILFPIAKLFFSEKRSRRKSAARILKEKKGMGNLGIALFGFRRKAASKGMVVALLGTLVESVSTLVRMVAYWTLKIALFYPLVGVRRALKSLKKNKQQSSTTTTTA